MPLALGLGLGLPFGGGPALGLPFSLSLQPIFYLDATLETGYSDGAALHSPIDRSTNQFAVTGGGGAADPTYAASVASLGNKPAFHFTGASSQLYTVPHSAILTPSTITIVAVVSATSFSSYWTIAAKTSNSGWTDGYALSNTLDGGSPSNISMWITAYSSHRKSGANLSLTTKYVLIGEYDAATILESQNGTESTFSDAVGITYSGTPVLRIGFAVGGAYLDGHLQRLCMFGGALTSGDRSKLNAGW